MPATQVPIGLNKQAVTDLDWHTPLNAGIDAANTRLTYSGNLDPNGLLVGYWLGHKYLQVSHVAWWVYTNPVLGVNTGWVREIAQGTIVMWSGLIGSIPPGWVLCNGVLHAPTGYTPPNLSGKFIVGYDAGDADYNAINNQGGAKTVTLSIGQMPTHSHGGFTGSASAATTAGAVNASGAAIGAALTTHSHSINPEGLGQAHENRPPYYTLAYLAKL